MKPKPWLHIGTLEVRQTLTPTEPEPQNCLETSVFRDCSRQLPHSLHHFLSAPSRQGSGSPNLAKLADVICDTKEDPISSPETQVSDCSH